MKYFVDYATAKDDTLVYIKLHPETASDREVLNSGDNDTIALYYQDAIDKKLGPDHSLLSVVDYSQWPNAAQVRVQRTVGLGR